MQQSEFRTGHVSILTASILIGGLIAATPAIAGHVPLWSYFESY